MKKIQYLVIIIASLFLSNQAYCFDSTSFNPEHVKITAVGGIPIGTVIIWPKDGGPADIENWLRCDGRAVPPAYEKLRSIMTHTPNYQGIFLRGHGSQTSSHYNSVTHSSGAVGKIQGDAIRNITGSFGGSISIGDERPDEGAIYRVRRGRHGRGSDHNTYYLHFNASRVVPIAPENRPVNMAVIYYIRAK